MISKTIEKCVGIVTPSTPAPALFPERYNRGKKQLTNLGFNIIESKFATTIDGCVAASAKNRAKDIMSLYVNSKIDFVIASLGGNYSAEVLPYIDWMLIQKHKKILIGYSDITILLIAFGVKGKQVSFYGPTLMTEFAEYPSAPKYSIESFCGAVARENLTITPVLSLYTDGTDWALPPTQRELSCVVNQRVIRSGICTGTVIGGCIESLSRLRGTEYWPCFKDAILLLETSEDEFNEFNWRSLLVDYKNMGVLDDVSGIIIGQKKWSDANIDILETLFLEYTKDRRIPILYGLPFGHISPIATLPLFARATLDAGKMTLIYDSGLHFSYNEG